MSLEKLIRPQSIAVVGVTDRDGSFGMHTARNALKSSNPEKIYFVHPKREMLFEKKCYPSLSALPERVDCVILCTPSKTINGLLREAGDQGIKAAMVFASGFSEELTPEGIRLEEEMADIGKAYDMKILGPNCMGIANYVDNKYMWGLGLPEDMETKWGGVGIVAQSGSIAANILHSEYIQISYGISSGNGNVTMLEEFAEFLVEDDQVKVVTLYLEGVKDARIFTRALKKAAEKRKPVVMLKGGKSDKGASSAASHTGNLAGSREAYESVFKKFGVIMVDDLEQLMCMSQMLYVLDGNYPHIPQFAALNLSGGENVICADLAEQYGVVLPDIMDETKAEMKKYLPGFATPKNPLDATTALFGNEENVIGLLMAFENDPNIGGVILGVNIRLKENIVWKIFSQSVVKAKQMGFTKPAFALPPWESSRNKEVRRILENDGFPLLSAISTGMKCIHQLAAFSEFEAKKKTLRIAAPNWDKREKTTTALSEVESKKEMHTLGIPIPVQKTATDLSEVKQAAEDLSFPLVLKINSPDILHKSDIGAVKLNLRNETETITAYNEIVKNVKEKKPEARYDGVLIEEMAPHGVEMIIGVKNDDQFGPMLLIGLGGVFVEVFEDVSLYPVPFNREEAHDMLKQLKGYALLNGYRGAQPCDIDALAEAMVRVSNYANEHKDEIKELDLNPVFVYPKGGGICAADAVIIKYQ